MQLARVFTVADPMSSTSGRCSSRRVEASRGARLIERRRCGEGCERELRRFMTGGKVSEGKWHYKKDCGNK